MLRPLKLGPPVYAHLFEVGRHRKIVMREGGVDRCRPVYRAVYSGAAVYKLCGPPGGSAKIGRPGPGSCTWDRAASISSRLTLPGGRKDGDWRSSSPTKPARSGSRLGGEGGLRHCDHGWSRSVLVNALTSRIFSLSHRRVAIVSAV
jgi:hypothetical protein